MTSEVILASHMHIQAEHPDAQETGLLSSLHFRTSAEETHSKGQRGHNLKTEMTLFFGFRMRRKREEES